MSRARAIETRLEKLTPSLDEYFSTGFLTRQEVQELARKRTHWEYRLVAKPLLLLDVQNAIRFELELEEKLKNYCASSKLTFRHRWTVLERIEGIYRIGLKNLRNPAEKEVMRKECVAFMKKFSRVAALGRLYGEWMIQNPMRSDIWTEAAEWTAIHQNKVDDGRHVIQQALVTMAAEPSVWASAMKIELHFCLRLIRGLLETHREAVRREKAALGEHGPPMDFGYETIPERLKKENESTSKIVLDLALVNAVVESALESPACSPQLIDQMVRVAASFPIGAQIIRTLRHEGAMRAIRMPQEQNSSQRARITWEEEAPGLIWSYLSVEHFIVTRAGGPLVLPIDFVRLGGTVSPTTSKERLNAAGITLVAAWTVVQELTSLSPSPVSLFFMESNASGFRSKFSIGVREMLNSLLRAGVDRSLISETTGRLLSQNAKSSFDLSFVREKLLLIHRDTATKSKRRGEDLSDAPAAVALGNEVVSELRAGVPPAQKIRREKVKAHSSSSGAAASSAFWLVEELSSLISLEDAVVTSTPKEWNRNLTSITKETVQRFMLWFNAMEITYHSSESASKKKKCKDECVHAAVELLLLANKLALEEKTNSTIAKRSGKKGSDTAFLSSSDFLSKKQVVLYNDGKNPICLWKVFMALERLCGGDGTNESSEGAHTKGAPSAESSSSDDDNEGSHGKSSLSSYASAGLQFLASASVGSLSEVEEWELVQGVCELVRSRIQSLCGDSIERVTRGKMVSMIRTRGASIVKKIKLFFEETRRCRPFPRHVLVTVVIPFYEALVLENPRDKKAVVAARAIHEEILSLYGFSTHLDHYPKVLFDGRQKAKECRTNLVREMNAKDWMRYVYFERFIAKDLAGGQKVMERAQRLCLAPQALLIANHQIASFPKVESMASSGGIYEDLN